MRSRSGLLLVGALTLARLAHALEWKETKFEHVAGPLDEAAEAVFRFTNTGPSPVTISGIKSSCGCTVPELEKRTYAPGEGGELRARFKFDGRVGVQHKTVTLQTDEPGAPSTVLSLKVTIPQLFETDRHFVVWRRGEAPEAKAIAVKVLDPELVKLVAVESRNPLVGARLERTDAPGVYRVVITPPPTDSALQSTIVVRSDFPAGNPRVIPLYALIR